MALTIHCNGGEGVASSIHCNGGEGIASSIYCNGGEGVASPIHCDGQGVTCTSYTMEVYITYTVAICFLLEEN